MYFFVIPLALFLSILLLFSWPIALGVLGILCLMGGVLIHPLSSFMTLLFIRPLVDSFREFYILPGLNILGIFSILNVIFLCLIFFRSKNFSWFPHNVRWFYLFIAISLCSFISSGDILGDSIAIFKLLSLLALFLLSYNLTFSIQDGLKILWAILLSAIIPIIIGLYQFIMHKGVIQDLTGFQRINATFSLSNPFAFYLGIIILVCLLMMQFEKKGGNKIFISIVLLASAGCLVLTYVRVVWIATIISMVIIAGFGKKTRILVLFVIVIAFIVFSGKITSRFDDIVNPPNIGTNSLSFRMDISRQLLTKAIPNHPFLGFGLGEAEEVATRFTTFPKLPHNDYLRILLETGFLGLSMYIIFIFGLFRYLVRCLFLRQSLNINIIFLGSLIFYLIASLGQNCFTYISTSGYVFCLMGLAEKFNVLKRGERT